MIAPEFEPNELQIQMCCWISKFRAAACPVECMGLVPGLHYHFIS